MQHKWEQRVDVIHKRKLVYITTPTSHEIATQQSWWVGSLLYLLCLAVSIYAAQLTTLYKVHTGQEGKYTAILQAVVRQESGIWWNCQSALWVSVCTAVFSMHYFLIASQRCWLFVEESKPHKAAQCERCLGIWHVGALCATVAKHSSAV